MNKKGIIVLAGALVFALLTAVSVNRMLKRSQSAFAEQRPKKVVVAAVKLGVGTQMKGEHLSVAEWPESLIPAGAFSDPEKLVNRVTITEIFPGEPILEGRIAPEGSAAGLSAIIPPGARAMTVRVDEVIGVAGFVAPGTYVDVVATVAEGPGGQESASKVILQNVRVLASGQSTEMKKEGGAVEVKTVTLQVTPEQAEILALASNAGKLQLVMRNMVDRETIATKGADTVSLFQGRLSGKGSTSSLAQAVVSKPAGSKKPKQEAVPSQETLTRTTVVELIRGNERTTITFQ